MRIAKDSAASGAKLLVAGHAVINPGALVLALRFPVNLGDAVNLATVNTTALAIGASAAIPNGRGNHPSVLNLVVTSMSFMTSALYCAI